MYTIYTFAGKRQDATSGSISPEIFQAKVQTEVSPIAVHFPLPYLVEKEKSIRKN